MKHIKQQSQTTAMLYQHPTPENTVRYKRSGLIIPSLIVITICLGGMANCSGYQNATAKMGIANEHAR